MGVRGKVLSAECWVLSAKFSVLSAKWQELRTWLRLVIHCLVLSTLVLLFAACTPVQPPTKVALLAPFEGRYREIGYNALYAARLAMQDAGSTQIELLPVDDGGTSVSANSRAHALQRDPQLAAVLVVGPASTEATVLESLSGIPTLVVGHWGAQPEGDHVFVLASREIDALLTIPARVEVTDEALFDDPTRAVIGNEILALEQFRLLGAAYEDVTVLTSAALPSTSFATRYHESDPFAPEPGLLASLTYDATGMVINVVRQHGRDRAAVRDALAQATYSGFNGLIQFEEGYWQNAPLHTYAYNDDGELFPVEGVIE